MELELVELPLMLVEVQLVELPLLELELVELPLLMLPPNLELVELGWPWPCHEAVVMIANCYPYDCLGSMAPEPIRSPPESVAPPRSESISAHEKTPENKHPQIRYECWPSSPGSHCLRGLAPPASPDSRRWVPLWAPAPP